MHIKEEHSAGNLHRNTNNLVYSKTDNLIRYKFKTHLSLVLQTHVFVSHKRIVDNTG